MKSKTVIYFLAAYAAYYLYQKSKKPGYKITVPEPDILTEDQFKNLNKEKVTTSAQVDYVQPVQVFTNPPAQPIQQPAPAIQQQQAEPVPVEASALVNFVPSGTHKEPVSYTETGVSTIQRPGLNVAGNFPNYY